MVNARLSSMCACLVLVAWAAAADESVPTRIGWRALGEPGCGGWITSVAVSPHDSRRVLVGGDVLGIGLSEDGGESWQPAFGLASWEIADFTWHPLDPATVWVGTMSGPYVSTDGGRNWQPRRTGFPPVAEHQYSAPIQKVLFDPGNPARLLAFGGSHRRMNSPGNPLWGAVWESRDAGNTWTRLATLPADGRGANVVAAEFCRAAPNVVYAAVAGHGVYASADGGRTWAPRNSGLPMNLEICRLAVHPQKSNVVWAAFGSHRHPEEHELTPGSIYKTTDGGVTWRHCGRGLGAGRSRDPNFTARYQAIAVAPANPDVLLTCDTAWDGSVMYRSSDGGESWQPILSRKDVDCAYPAGLALTVIEFDPRDPKVVFAAGSEYMIRTTDGGKTWTDVTARRAAGPDSWTGRGYSGLCAVNFKWDPFDPRHAALIAMDHGNFWHSRDGLRSWTWGGKGMPAWGGASDVVFADRQVMYVSLGQFGSFNGIARTTDGGASWTVLESFVRGLPNKGARAQPTGLHALPGDPRTVWAIVGGELLHTSDGGENWKTVHRGPDLRWIAADSRQPRRFYVSGRAGVYQSDGGAALELMAGSPKDADRLAVDTSDPPRVYAVSWRTPHGGLWRFDGNRWTRIRQDPYTFNVAVDPTDPRRLAVATNDHPYHDVCRATGVWVSEDGGATWSQQNAGLPCLRGECIAVNPHDPEQWIFGTLGCGYFIGRWPKR